MRAEQLEDQRLPALAIALPARSGGSTSAASGPLDAMQTSLAPIGTDSSLPRQQPRKLRRFPERAALRGASRSGSATPSVAGSQCGWTRMAAANASSAIPAVGTALAPRVPVFS